MRRLYVLPLPCLGFVIEFKPPDLIELYRGVTYYPDNTTGKGSPPCNMSIRLTPKNPTAYVSKIGCGPTTAPALEH